MRNPRSCLENPPRADGVVRAELVAFETGAAEIAVQWVHIPVYFHEYSHRAHIDADTTFPAPVRIDIHFKQYGCRPADFHGGAHGPGRQPGR